MKKPAFAIFVSLTLLLFTSPLLNAQTLSTIATDPVFPQFCLPATLNVTFTTNGNANAGNVFTAQLSDIQGSFAAPLNIGTLTSTTAAAIACTIPNTVGDGGPNYRIRVVSSTPAVTGSNNGGSIVFGHAPSPITNLSGPPIVCGNKQITYSANGGLPQYSVFWYITGNCGTLNSSNGMTASFNTNNVLVPTIGTIGVSSGLGFCNSSSSVQTTVYPSQQAALTISGATTFCQGDSVILTSTNTPEGGSLSFDGIDDYVNVVNQPVLGNHFTEEAWIYSTSSADNTWHGIIGVPTSLGWLRPPALYVYNGTDIHGGFGDGTNWNDIIAYDVIKPNSWNLISMTFDSVTLTLYVNGNSVLSTTAYAGITPYATPVSRIGGLDVFFKGKIDEVRLWNVARTQAEIQQGMTYVLPTQSGLNTFYKMNEGTGTSIGNVSGNLIAATMANAPSSPVWNNVSAPTGYLWSNGKRTPSVTIKTSGSYSLNFTNTYGCSTNSLSPTTVTVNPLPVVTSGTQTYCDGSSITLGGSPSGGSVNVPNPYTGSSTPFTYTYTDNNGCTNSANGYANGVLAPYNMGPLVIVGGISKACPGETKTFTVDSVSPATYTWTVPAGATITSGQGTYKCKVKFGVGFLLADSVKVQVSNFCGMPANFSLYVQRNDPAQPSTITGSAYGVCNLSTVPYSVVKVTGMTYNWSYSNSNASVATGQGTKGITANYGPGFTSGTLSVTAQNACGISPVRTKTIYAKPATPAVLVGPGSVCALSTGVTYSIAPIPNTTNYTWTCPAGAQIYDGVNAGSTLVTTATAVTVNYGFSGGTLKVRGNNGCAFGAYKTKTISIICREDFAGGSQDEIGISVFPNPASTEATVLFNTTKEGAFKLKLFDTLGKIVLNSAGFAQAGESQIKLNLQDIVPGIYMIEILVNGKNKFQKIVVQ